MKAADVEWSMIRGALIALAIALVVSIGMLSASYQFWESTAKSLKGVERQLRTARDKFRTIDEQEVMIATYYPQFQELERQGIVGRERRLNWIENLSRADESLKLPKLVYSIDTQAPFTAEFPLASGAYELYVSKMNLTLGLLHGRDLFNLLSWLDDDAEGLYSVDNCDLVRQIDEPGSPKQIHLTSDCELLWYTIRKPGDTGAAS